MSGRQKFYDWAADPVFTATQGPANLPVPYAPPGVPAVVPPNARVVHVPGQLPVYAYQPQPLPPYDPLPQRMYGCGVMGFCILSGVALVEAGSYLMFAGMALATHALVGVAAVFVSGTVALVAVRLGGGIRIKNFHQGDGSIFRTGR